MRLVPDLEIGNASREIVDLAIQTHRAGWRSLIASAGGPLVLEAERSAVRHTTLPKIRKSAFSRARLRSRLEALIQREHPILVHLHGLEMLPSILKPCGIRNLPLIVDLTEPASTPPFLKKALEIAIAQNTLFRVPSDFMRQHLEQDLGIPAQLIHLIPPGVDTVWFDASRVLPERLYQLNRLWRLPEQATIIMMATPMAPGFGHERLLGLLARLKRDDVFVVLIGDDRTCPGMRAEIEKTILTFELETKVVMPETCPDWAAACWLSSFFVAINESPRGQAPELLMAQSLGRPAIVSDCGANSEMVLGGETAWVIPLEDKDALESALLEAINMSEVQRIDLAVRAREFAIETFSQAAWRDAMFDLYKKMLA